MNEEQLESARKFMVENHISKRGIHNNELISAMLEVPRENFIAHSDQIFAYWDGPLSIGEGQTISQPYIVALMIDSLNLQSNDKVLEIGTGSGYNAAVMSKLVREVHSIEVVYNLFTEVKTKLEPYPNIFVYYGDGHEGLPFVAPFDKIILTAAPTSFPENLWQQLREGGKMVVPIGEEKEVQKLYLFQKINGERKKTFIENVVFVPMVSRNLS